MAAPPTPPGGGARAQPQWAGAAAAALPAPLVRKLSHPLAEVRCRALDSASFKLSAGLASAQAAAAAPGFLEALLQWYNFEDATRHCDVARLLARLAADSAACAGRLEALGAREFFASAAEDLADEVPALKREVDALAEAMLKLRAAPEAGARASQRPAQAAAKAAAEGGAKGAADEDSAAYEAPPSPPPAPACRAALDLAQPGDAEGLAAQGLFGAAARAEYARGRAEAAQARACAGGSDASGGAWGVRLRRPHVAAEDAQALFEINLRLEHAADADAALRALTELRDRAVIDCMAEAVLARPALVRNVAALLHASASSGVPALAAEALVAVLRAAAHAAEISQDGGFDVALPAPERVDHTEGAAAAAAARERKHTPGTVDYARSYPPPALGLLETDADLVNMSAAAHMVAHHALGALHSASRNPALMSVLAAAVPLLAIGDEDVIAEGDAQGRLVLQADARFSGYFEVLSSAAEIAERDVDGGGPDAVARAIARVLNAAAAFLELLPPEAAAPLVPPPLASHVARACFTGAVQMSRPELAARLRPYASAADPAAAEAYVAALGATDALAKLEVAAKALRAEATIDEHASVAAAALEAIAAAVSALGAAPDAETAAAEAQELLCEAAALGLDAALEAGKTTAALVAHASDDVRAAALGVLAPRAEAEVAASAASGGARAAGATVAMLSSPSLLDALTRTALHVAAGDAAPNAARCLLAAARAAPEGRRSVAERAAWIACAARAGSASAAVAGSTMGSLIALVEAAGVAVPFPGAGIARDDLVQLAPALRALFSVDSAVRGRGAMAVLDVARGGQTAALLEGGEGAEWRGATARAAARAEMASMGDVVADPLGAALAAGYEPDRPYGLPVAFKSRSSCANAPDLARVAANLKVGGNVRAAAAEQLIALSHDVRLEPILADEALLAALLEECGGSGESWGGAARASAAGLLASAAGASCIVRAWLAADGRLMRLAPLLFHASMAARRAAAAAIAYVVFDPRAIGTAAATEEGPPAHMLELPLPFAEAYTLPCEVRVAGGGAAAAGTDFSAARELVSSLVLFSSSARAAIESLQAAREGAVDGPAGRRAALDLAVIKALHVEVAPARFARAVARAASHAEASGQVAAARDACATREGAQAWLAGGAGEAVGRFLGLRPTTRDDHVLLVDVLALLQQLLASCAPADIPDALIAQLVAATRDGLAPTVEACCAALVKQDSAKLEAATGVPGATMLAAQSCLRVLAALAAVVAVRGRLGEARALAAAACGGLSTRGSAARSLLVMCSECIIPWRDSSEARARHDASRYGLRVLAIRAVESLAAVAMAADEASASPVCDHMAGVAASCTALVTCVAVERRERPTGLRGRGAAHAALSALLSISAAAKMAPAKEAWARAVAASGGTYWLSRACRDPWAPARCAAHALLAALASCAATRALVERCWPEAGQYALLAAMDVRECAAARGAAFRCVAEMLAARAAVGVDGDDDNASADGAPGRRPYDLAAGLSRSLQLWEAVAAAGRERAAQAPCVLRGATEALARAALAAEDLDVPDVGPLPAPEQTWAVLLPALAVPDADGACDAILDEEEAVGALLAHAAFPGAHSADACGAVGAICELMSVAAARSEAHRAALRAQGGARAAAGALATLAAAGGLVADPAADAERVAASAAACSALALLTGDRAAPWWAVDGGANGRSLATAALSGVTTLLRSPAVRGDFSTEAPLCRGVAALLATPAEAAAALGDADVSGAPLASALLATVDAAGDDSVVGEAALSALRCLLAHSTAAKGAAVEVGLPRALVAQALHCREAWTLSGGAGASAQRRNALLSGATRSVALLRHLALRSRRGADACAEAGAARAVSALWPVARSAAAGGLGGAVSDGGALRLELIALVANIGAAGSSGSRRALAAGGDKGALALAFAPANDPKAPAALVKAALRAAHCAATGPETRAVVASPKSVALAACARLVAAAYPGAAAAEAGKGKSTRRAAASARGATGAVKLAEQALLTLAAVAAHQDGATAVLRCPATGGLVALACAAARAPARGARGAAARRAAAAAVALLRNVAFASEAKAHFVSGGGAPLKALIDVAGGAGSGGGYPPAARAHAASALWALAHNGQKVVACLRSMGEGTRDALAAAEQSARADAIAMAAMGGDTQEALAGAGALLSHGAACLACCNVLLRQAWGWQ